MIFKNLCVLVVWTKVASALEGLTQPSYKVFRIPSSTILYDKCDKFDRDLELGDGFRRVQQFPPPVNIG